MGLDLTELTLVEADRMSLLDIARRLTAEGAAGDAQAGQGGCPAGAGPAKQSALSSV